MKLCVAIVIAGLLTLFNGAGCVPTLHYDSSYTPVSLGDGKGGAFVLYSGPEKGGLRDFYAQRISPDGRRLWGDKGILLGSGYREQPAFQDLDIADGGRGGIFVGWRAQLSKSGSLLGHVGRLDPQGGVLWQRELAPYNMFVGDGAGGLIVAYDHAIGTNADEYDESVFSLVKIDGQGSFSWGQYGVALPRTHYWPSTLEIAGDNGRVVAVWEEMEFQPGAVRTTSRLLGQKMDADGALAWGPAGKLLHESGQGTRIDQPTLTIDGEGAIVVAWQQMPQGGAESGTSQRILWDVSMQRFGPDGEFMWQPDGIVLGITRNAEKAGPHSPVVVGDGAAAVIVMWEDLRNGLVSIYAQKVSSDSTQAWQMGGEKALYIPGTASLAFRQIVGDGQGGVIISGGFLGGVDIQKMDSLGNVVWGDNGVVVTRVSTTCHLSSDGQSGAIVAWGTGGGSYIQRIGADGNLSWRSSGIRLDATEQ